MGIGSKMSLAEFYFLYQQQDKIIGYNEVTGTKTVAGAFLDSGIYIFLIKF